MAADDRAQPSFGREARAVFVQDFAAVDRPYQVMVERVGTERDVLFERALRIALAEGDRLRASVGPALWPTWLGRTVSIVPGPERHSTDGLLVAFRWVPVGHGGPFPRLDADLEVVPFGPSVTVLSIRGRYRPPAELLSTRGDGILLHRIAESTVRAFLAGICATLTEEPGGPRPGRAGSGEPGARDAAGSGASTGGGPDDGAGDGASGASGGDRGAGAGPEGTAPSDRASHDGVTRDQRWDGAAVASPAPDGLPAAAPGSGEGPGSARTP